MRISYSKQYLADFAALRPDEQDIVVATVELFTEQPFHSSLNNHALEGRLKGKRAIAADQDLRIVFRVHADYAETTLIAVGPHRKVYRR